MKSQRVRRQGKPGAAKNGDFSVGLDVVHPNAAGIDVGNEEHYVAVPPGSDPDGKPVRRFRSVTAESRAMVEWLKRCKITTVAMQSTGVYWLALYQLLERAGFMVFLVNASHTKNLPGRKTDVQECQWILKLHTFGMLSNSFLPSEEIRAMRTIWRQRNSHIGQASQCLQRMQKALVSMNLRFHNIAADISGVTAMRMIRAILGGERNAAKLAKMREPGIKASEEEIIESLDGCWQPDLIFCLGQQVSLYDTFQGQIRQCDEWLAKHMGTIPDKEAAETLQKSKPNKRAKGNAPSVATLDLRTELHRITGVDLTSIDGINVLTAQTIVAECGTDLAASWASENHFVAWLRLCPRPEQSGKNVNHRRGSRTSNPVTVALRQAATTLIRSKSYLGAKYRKIQARIGKKSAVKAMAAGLARLAYRLMTKGHAYVDKGAAYFEEKHAASKLVYLRKKAAELGMELIDSREVA